MSKQESYSVLTEPEPAPVPVAASKTGTSHTLTVTVDKKANPKTASISNKSLPIENGDAVIWEFFDASTGRHLGDSSVKIVFATLKKSKPGNPDANSKVSADILEETNPGTYSEKYSVQLGGTVLKTLLRTLSGDELLDDSPQLVIDNMGKPPGKRGPGRDDEGEEGAGHHSWRQHRAG